MKQSEAFNELYKIDKKLTAIRSISGIKQEEVILLNAAISSLKMVRLIIIERMKKQLPGDNIGK